MITSITDELKFSWDPGISSVFSGADLTLSATCAFSDLPLTTTGLSRRSILPPPPCFGLDARPTVLDHHHDSIDMIRVWFYTRHGQVFLTPGKMMRTSRDTSVLLVKFIFALFYFILVVFFFVFSSTLVKF